MSQSGVKNGMPGVCNLGVPKRCGAPHSKKAPEDSSNLYGVLRFAELWY
jgi:hypothetical protein